MKHLLNCFYIACTHPSGGVYVPFVVVTIGVVFTFDFGAIIGFN